MSGLTPSNTLLPQRVWRMLGYCGLLWLCLLGLIGPASARPVTFPGGQVAVVDLQPNSTAWRYGYSGSFRWSVSGGGLTLRDVRGGDTLRVNYVRGGRLLKRWNWPQAQANVFVWGGAGYGGLDHDHGLTGHVGFQADFETRKIYTSVVSEHHEGDHWRYRMDTVALGFAPYEHDYDRMATWIVLKGMRTTHTIQDKPKAALMIRLFNPTWWIEAGIDHEGQLLGNVMFNF